MKYTILASLVTKLEEKLTKFKKKFDKFGKGAFKYEKSEQYICEDKSSRFFNKVVVDVELEGFYKVDNYEFVASLEWVEEKKENLVYARDGIKIPEEYRFSSKCEHCGIKRFRKYTTLLKNTITGKYIQVGNSCLADYFGKSICQYANYLELFNKIEEQINDLNEYGFTQNVDNSYSVMEILEQAAADKRERGYISKNTSYETGKLATSSRVYYMLTEIPYNGRQIKKYEITDEDEKFVNEIKDFYQHFVVKDEYSKNLKLLLSCKSVDASKIGYVVSSVGAYLREVSKLTKVESQHVGKIGEKIVIEAEPKLIFERQGEYGMSYGYRFIYENNEFIWVTGRYLKQEKIALKGTIKEHNTFNGIKQTILTRCKEI